MEGEVLPPRNKKRDIFKVKKRQEEKTEVVQDNNIHRDEVNPNTNNNVDLPRIRQNERINQNSELPEFLRNADNEQVLQMYIRMRQRHFSDGAVSLNVEGDDIGDNNLELYDNRGINIELPHLNEKLAQNVEYYVEAANRDKFYKINAPMKKKPEDGLKIGKKKSQGKKITSKTGQKELDINRVTEDEMFRSFDNKLSEIIVMTTGKISLLFLFMQGLLAGNYL